MKTDQTLTLILTLTLNLNLTLTLSLTLKRETKERNLEEEEEEEKKTSGFELPNSQTNRIAYDNPTNRATWQFVANYIFSLPFIAQHVIDKKLVLSLTRLSFSLVRFRFDPGATAELHDPPCCNVRVLTDWPSLCQNGDRNALNSIITYLRLSVSANGE